MTKTEATRTAASTVEAAQSALFKMEDHFTAIECAAALVLWLGMAERNGDLPGADLPSGRVKDNALHFVTQALGATSEALRRHHGKAHDALGALRAATA